MSRTPAGSRMRWPWSTSRSAASCSVCARARARRRARGSPGRRPSAAPRQHHLLAPAELAPERLVGGMRPLDRVVDHERRGLRGPRLRPRRGARRARRRAACPLRMAVREHDELAQCLARVELLGPRSGRRARRARRRAAAGRARAGRPGRRAGARGRRRARASSTAPSPRRRRRPRRRGTGSASAAGRRGPCERRAGPGTRRRPPASASRRAPTVSCGRSRSRWTTASAASGSGDWGRGPTTTLAPPSRRVSPSRREQPGEVGADPTGVQRRVGRGEPARDVGHVGDAREIDVRGAPPRLAQLRRVRQEQTRLAVAPRRREPHADAVGRAPPQESSAPPGGR